MDLLSIKQLIGKSIQVQIDHPLGSRHPEWGFIYPINYGYLSGLVASDGEDLDVYVLGVFEPVSDFYGWCIAIIHRLDDHDDKLVLAPEGRNFSDEQIIALTEFQERFFTSTIVR